MDRSHRSLWLALAALILPCVAVGWYGVVQIGRVEEVLIGAERRKAAAELEDAVRETVDVVETFLRASLGRIPPDRLDRMEEALRALERSDRAIDHAILLDEGLGVVVPRPARRVPFQGLSARLPWRGRYGRGPASEAALLAEAAAVMELAGDIDGAIEGYGEMLRRLRAAGPRVPGREGLEARTAVVRGALLLRAGRREEAVSELQEALARMAAVEEGPRDLFFDAAEARVACIFLLARAAIQEDAAEGVEQLMALGAAIAGGDHDEVSDEVLEATMARIGSLLVRADPEGDTAVEWEAVQAENALRAERRAFAADFAAFGTQILSRSRLQDPAADLYCLDWSTPGNTAILAFKRIAGEGGGEAPLWAGVHVDLRSLLLDRLRHRMSSEDTDLRFDLFPPGEAPAPPAGEASLLVVEQALPKPLAGFVLRGQPSDPDLLLGRARKLVQWKYALPGVLALVALLGGWFLARVLRREAELARLKVDFLGRVSHELKTPVALIRMYGDTLALGRAGDPERASSFGAIIVRESDRLTGMLDNVLEFSRMSEGARMYKPAPVDVAALLGELAEAWRPHLEQRGFTLELRAAPVGTVRVDREAMARTFANLVDNAVKYADKEGKAAGAAGTAGATRALEVEARRENGRAVVDFMDRGIGVPPTERSRIFEKFYRGSSAGERPGAGLGLAMVRHFMDSHGGSVEALAREGGGTVFRLTFPLEHAPAGAPEVEEAPGEGGTA